MYKAKKTEYTGIDNTDVETCIPFCGFYDSWASGIMDNDEMMELENAFEGFCRCPQNEKEYDRLHEIYSDLILSGVDYQKGRLDIASQYVNQAERELEIPLTFKELDSPREYNFTTDRIFCTAKLGDLKKLMNAIPKEAIAKEVKERFTSYDGFCSHYSNDYETWLAEGVETFDHNQWETVIRAYIKVELNQDEGTFIDNCLEYVEYSTDYTEGVWEKMEAVKVEIAKAIIDTKKYEELMKAKKQS